MRTEEKILQRIKTLKSISEDYLKEFGMSNKEADYFRYQTYRDSMLTLKWVLEE
jgi:hypothetical protein